MVEQRTRLLPLHQLLTALQDWRSGTLEQTNQGVHDALNAVIDAYGVRGAYVVVDASWLPTLHLGAGSLTGIGDNEWGERGIGARELELEGSPDGRARIWVDGEGEPADALAAAFELTLDAVSSRHQARLQRQQLEALDGAVRGIAAVQSVDTVLQLIVDRVRALIGAEYAALGIVGPFDNIEQFVTSGLSHRERERIGALPQGRGLLGLIIQEDSSFLVDDIATDPRRYGFPPHHPEMHSFLGAPVRSKGRSIGNLYLANKISGATFSAADLRLVEMFALHAGIAMENARLHAEVQRLAVVDERQRISQDLHDSIIQSLYATSLSLEDLPDVIAEDPAEGAARADRAIESIHATIRDIRNFIFGLQPELLETADLGSGIRSMAAEFRGNTLIDLEVEVATDLPEMPGEFASHILAITREGLSNIAKHSRATQASVELRVDNGVARLTIGDNGQGFDPTQPRSSERHGLANLHARAEALGGSLTISCEPDEGTRVVAEIPMRTDG